MKGVRVSNDIAARATSRPQIQFSPSGGEGLPCALPSRLERGAGCEGLTTRNLPFRWSTRLLPSPQTPLPRGEGLHLAAACSGPVMAMTREAIAPYTRAIAAGEWEPR